MSSRRPSDSGRPDKHKPPQASKKPYPVARPANPPPGYQRPLPAAAPQGRSASPRPAKPDPNLVFNLHDPAVPELARPRRAGFFKRMRQAALVFFVILLGVGTVAFAFTYRKGRKSHHAEANAVAKVDTKEHGESEKKPEKKTDVGEKKPEEKKPEEKKPAEKVEEKKPVEKKPEEKKPEEKKPAEKVEEKKPAERKPEEKKPAEKKPEEKKPEEKKPETTGNPAGDPKFANIIFEKDILPIFNAKCIFCHGDKKKKGGLDMRTVELMIKGGESGASLVRGQPEKSPLWLQIEEDLMPKNEKLSKEDKDKIRKWILGGARDAAMAAK